MPSIGRIQSTNFQALLTDLGITRNNIPFDLRSEVTPVVLVGGTVSFLASPTPAYRVTDIFTAGLLTAPVSGTVMADTLQLPIGAYSLYVEYNSGDTAILYDFQWRDAANAVNLWTQRIMGTDDRRQVMEVRLDVQNDNERFRVVSFVNGTAAVTYQVSILART